MDERRRYRRFNFQEKVLGTFRLTETIVGEFKNLKQFRLQNISMGGLNLLTDFSLNMGSIYTVHIEHEGEGFEFEIEARYVKRTKIDPEYEKIFDPHSAVSVGCKIVEMEKSLWNFFLYLIQNKCELAEPETKKDPQVSGD